MPFRPALKFPLLAKLTKASLSLVVIWAQLLIFSIDAAFIRVAYLYRSASARQNLPLRFH